MHFSFCLSVSAMSLNNLSYSDLQRRLDDPQQRDELVQLAREARPGRAARGGLLTREQRAWLHCNVATKKAAVSEHVAKQPLLASPAGSIVSPSPAPVEKHELLFDDHATRSYCWESLPRPGADKVILRNWLFSDARNFTAVPYQVQRVAVEAGDWRKGFWSDCSWRKGPLELGSDNEITRKHSVQCTDSTAVTSVSLPNLDFASICARDERRLEKACRRKRRKRQQSTSSS